MLQLKATLIKRIASALVLAPLTIALIVLGGWYFIALILLASIISLYELSHLIWRGKNRYAHLVFALVYLCLCFGAYIFVRFGFEHGAFMAIAVIVSVWASDTGAYIFGKAFGGAKLAPKLSPKKTWAGFGGSMFSCALVLLIISYLGAHFGYNLMPMDPLGLSEVLIIICAGLVIGAVGQAGDLLMSYYKRRVDAKDTGNLIPGHGGLLDRIDALMLVCPVFLGFLLLCH